MNLRRIVIVACSAILMLSVAKAAIDGTESSMQRQQVSVGQLQIGMGTGTASSNAVTINNGSGVITTEALTTTAGSTQAITLTNNRIAAGDIVFAIVDPASSAGTPTVANVAVSANTAVILVKNIHGSNALNAAIKIYFMVVKSGNAN